MNPGKKPSEGALLCSLGPENRPKPSLGGSRAAFAPGSRGPLEAARDRGGEAKCRSLNN